MDRNELGRLLHEALKDSADGLAHVASFSGNAEVLLDGRFDLHAAAERFLSSVRSLPSVDMSNESRPENQRATIDITCTSCGRLIYRKEYREGW